MDEQYKEFHEMCKVESKEHPAERVAGWLVLGMTFMYLGLIFLGVISSFLGWT